MTRAFVALDVDPEGVASLVAAADALRSCAPAAARPRWALPEQMHLTVKFLGNAAEPVLEAMAHVVSDLGGGPAPRARLSGLRGFPSDRRARVLVMALDDPAGELARLANAVEARACALGLARDGASALRAARSTPEERGYSPHVTLARLGDLLRIDSWLARVPIAPLDLGLTALTLYRSDSTPSGSRYTPLASLGFA